MPKNHQTVREKAAIQPALPKGPIEQIEDILDWDFSLPQMPARSSGKVRVRLVFAGRSKPIVETPSD